MPLSRAEWTALGMAVVLAHAFYGRTVLYPSAYDATEYLNIANDIARTGVLGNFVGSRLRTYGYPLFLLGNREVAEALRLPWAYVVFIAQLALHLGAALVVRRAIGAQSASLARVALVALAVNPLALIYTPETLTESLSLSLLVFAVGAWVFAWRGGPGCWVAIALGSLILGASVAVRPANVFALPAWAVAGVALVTWQRWNAGSTISATFVTLAFLAVPMLPQLANNVRHHGVWTPLIAAPLGRDQQSWGIAYLKYATALPPVPIPSIYYLNPFAEGRPVDPLRPRDWYRRHPGPGAATLGLHTFGMLDQDLLFTYARDLDPWYRRLVGVLVHGAIALALLGGASIAAGAWRDRQARVVLAALGGFAGSHIVLHSMTAVEMRFGLPLLALAGPLALWTVRTAWPRTAWPARTAAAAFVAAWIATALVLSDWMRAQSTQIRAWEEQRAATSAPR